MLTIAFDQNTSVIGYGVWFDGSLAEHGAFSMKQKKVLDRINYGKDKISYIIDKNILSYVAQNDNINDKIQILFEDIQLQDTVSIRSSNGFGKQKEDVNVRTFKTLAMALGVYQLAAKTSCEKITLPYDIKLISPSKWRSGVGIKSKIRKDQKNEAIEKVKKEFNFTPSEDEAEAILIGLYNIKKDCF